MRKMSEITLETKVFTDSQLGIRPIRLKRVFHQISRTITFEARRNLKKMIIMTLVSTLLVGLFLLINELQDTPPTEATDYVTSYLGMIGFIIMIIAITFGASIIVEDFEKQTGNLLFPKIEKGRLLVGRYITRYIYGCLSIMVFYLEVGILTYIKYETIPVKIWGSLGWAMVYLHLVLSFVVLMSALLNRIATATVMSILSLLIIFNLVTTILMVTESTVEPFFIVTYYSNIITSWFNMPETRYREIIPGRGGGGDGPISDRVFRQWVTPSAEGMIIGVVIYSAILLIGAYIIYRIKQMKE
jgi:ABC-type transport system involved in multi-copper enzyme maturation permease subunit